ncbi:DUF7507 domain-containing protein [Sphingobacterium wenxiniae]|uniref:Conserved repeat domain-containing protein n=1 Tax=Sphingobacterium wenxiniae TaxID=683125 RepID=A0A1I6VV75_9SPHI|nr:hypothetical protein [Sphingobacterium wenxiniae]SFT17625.1 conserved repeat domain-containing protein [Sphingobacterium wenxiniae]
MTIKKYKNGIFAQGLRLALLFVLLAFGQQAWADGSKDLHPSSVTTGNRAQLIHFSSGRDEAIPFPYRGAHYVYAKAGETITLASSVQSYNNTNSNKIALYDPNGNQVPLTIREGSRWNWTYFGNIPNRTAELAGPLRPGENANNNKYRPIYYTVPAGGEGIYRVEFESRDPESTSNGNWQGISNWSQGNDITILAWDISVVSGNNFIPGRVYATNLNLTMGNPSSGSTGYNTVEFRGSVYTRTHDGYTYRVTHKGSNGIVFAFFVNNRGFYEIEDGEIKLLYKSIDGEASTARNRVHNPNTRDVNGNITHKMFYTYPATDMPAVANASIGISNGSGIEAPTTVETWLNTMPIIPDVQNVKVFGVEGTEGRLGHKGGRIEFDAPVAGQYRIVMESLHASFTTRVFTGEAQEGHNVVFWDGKDGAGNATPGGEIPMSVKVILQGAEVHFPFFDVEYNIGGIAIELLNINNSNNVLTDRVFWDDTDLTHSSALVGNAVNPVVNSHLTQINGVFNEGQPSSSNGHNYGGGNHNGEAQNTWGDKKSIDTWTFVQGQEVNVTSEVAIAEADLYTDISYSIGGTSNKAVAEPGETVIFTVTAGNNGPSDVIADPSKNIKGAPFTFSVPGGIDIDENNVQVQVNCGDNRAGQTIPIIYDEQTRMFRSELSLPDGCSITYTFTGTLNGGAGSMVPESTIMRPADVTDPDATNGDPDTPPTNPHFECYNADGTVGGAPGQIGCNNITEVSFMVVPDCLDEMIYFEDFNRGFWATNNGRTDWAERPSVSITANGEILTDINGTVLRGGCRGGATSTYLFAPGKDDIRHAAAANIQPLVSRILPGYYAVLPPGYVKMGIPDTDPWHDPLQEWDPNAANLNPYDINANYDWRPSWDRPDATRDMSGAVNGGAFHVRGIGTAAQSVKPFYQIDAGTIQADKTYTLFLYSYVTYHDKDYMLMDVVDKESGFVYTSVPLKYQQGGTPPGSSPGGGFSLGWIPLEASFKFSSEHCDYDIADREVYIAIRGHRDPELAVGQGFGHTFIDNITFASRRDDANCEIVTTEIECVDECYLEVQGAGFGWSAPSGTPSPVTRSFTQPGTNRGFVLDIYELDNSFNMLINGVPLYDEELEFQGSNQNVRFAVDEARWENNGIPDIWKINQGMSLDKDDRFNNPIPAVRVVIDQNGNVTLYGQRASYDGNGTGAANVVPGQLELLEVFGTVPTLNTVAWNETNDNNIEVSQNVIGITAMKGFGYGLNAKDCETCKILKDGEFNGSEWAEVGQTITYTFQVINMGDMDILDVEIVDPLFGFNITLDEDTHEVNQPEGVTIGFIGDENNNGILNRNETWTFMVDYTITSEDIYTNQGVYNRATVNGIGRINETSTSTRQVQELSTDPTPYDNTWERWDPERPFHTFVPLKGNGLLITNPMIYQRIKDIQ